MTETESGESGTTAAERTATLRKAFKARDSSSRSQILQQLIATSGDPENVIAVPVLLRALANRREPERQIVDALRALGLRRVGAVLEHHMPELVEAARSRIEPLDEDELDELPALD